MNPVPGMAENVAFKVGLLKFWQLDVCSSDCWTDVLRSGFRTFAVLAVGALSSDRWRSEVLTAGPLKVWQFDACSSGSWRFEVQTVGDLKF